MEATSDEKFSILEHLQSTIRMLAKPEKTMKNGLLEKTMKTELLESINTCYRNGS